MSMPLHSSSRASSATREWLVVVAILFLVGGVAFASARQQSITTDEIVHIPAGVTYLQLHDARMNPEHPPLLKVFAALPLVVGGIRLDYSLPHWDRTKDALFGEEAFSKLGPASASWILAARVPMILVMLALGATIFWMARRLTDATGGFLALLVFATTPFFYAYGSLVHTDIGIALFSLVAVWTFASFWQDPDWPHTIRFAVCFSAALLTKFTAGLLLPTFFIVGVWLSLRHRRGILLRVLRFSMATVIAALIVYAFYFCLFWTTDTADILDYRFEHSVAPIPAMHKLAEFLAKHQSLKHLLSPPIIYLLGVGHTLHALPRTTYLLGTTYLHGTALYFPALFAYKMPLGYLLLVALLVILSALSFMRKRDYADDVLTSGPDHLRALLALFFVYTAASLASPLNIGIRHFSVPIATLTVLLAMLVPLARNLSWPAIRRGAVAVAVVALLSSSVATVAAYPNFIPYFNSLVGKHPKFDVAIDSNLDWGQGLGSLEQFHKQHPATSLAFDLKGSVPAVYLPEGIPFNCEHGAPAGVDWAAIGASRFVNQPESGQSTMPPPQQCRDFFSHPYQVTAGGAVYIFHLGRQEAQK